MRIAILGAGVIGVTTAYELSRNPDNEIVVVELNSKVASEASGVNAFMIAPGHSYAWASPKVPGILLKSIYRNDQAFRIRFRFDFQFWKWTALFLKQCNNADAVRNTLSKHALCCYSQKRLGIVVQECVLEYDRLTRGLLYLFRNSTTFEKGIEHAKLLADNGQELKNLNSDEVVDLEPAYTTSVSKIAGAVYSPSDETGNSQKFTRQLAQICQSRGVRFLLKTKIESLVAERNTVRCAKSSSGDIEADLFVVSMGAHTPLLLKPVGIDLPIYPVKGYSTTLPVGDEHSPPVIGTVDEDNLVAFSPSGNAIRATATAEFAGYNLAHKPKDFKPMLSAIEDLLPNAADYAKPIYRTCFRPMTPQGTPYIGFTRYDNLFVNSGQGHMGWTMACGSAKISADLISGHKPEIDASSFTPVYNCKRSVLP